MSLASILSFYVSFNLTLIAAFASLKLWAFLGSRSHRALSARSELKLHYLVLTAVVVVMALNSLLPGSEFFEPAAKLWSAESLASFSEQYTGAQEGGYLRLPAFAGELTVKADTFSLSLMLMALAASLLAAALMGRDLRLLNSIRRSSFVIRKFGNLRILLNDELQVPFSCWTPGRRDVVIPTSILSKPHQFKIALAHELQHHRQRDTQWVYVLSSLKLVCALNPIVYLWSRWLSELQEFACDETLVDQHKVESQQYARCLVEVAESANSQKQIPARATGLVFLVERTLLKRRIEKMFNSNVHKSKRSISVPLSLSLLLMAGVAYATNGTVQDRRVSMNDAERLVANVEQDEFPVVVNDLVLKQLNRYIGTPDGREFMRDALRRLETYRPLVESKLAEYEVPANLIAIPIIESGYQNLEQKPIRGWGAGIWMFIAETAIEYGLRVHENLDERLNPELLTDAAMRLLKADKLRFKDWQLSVLSYNVGPRKVHAGIKATDSRDAWTLVRAGIENDRDYLPKLMAAIIIMKNPRSVE